MKKIIIRVFLFVFRAALLIGICAGLFYLGQHAYEFGHQIYDGSGVEEAPGTDMAVVIQEGQSVQEIARLLERYGLIRDEKVFLVQERLSRYHGQIQPGNYILNTSQDGNTMIAILTGHESELETSGEELK